MLSPGMQDGCGDGCGDGCRDGCRGGCGEPGTLSGGYPKGMVLGRGDEEELPVWNKLF